MSPLTRRYHVPSALRPTSFRIEPADAHELIAEGALLVDVRRHDDPTFELAGARRVPPDEIPDGVQSFPRDVPIVLACA